MENDAFQEFDSLFLKTLSLAMVSLFSAEVTESLYANLLEFHGITREQVPSHVEKLQTVLQEVFGRSGLVIERHISKRLFAALGCQFVLVANYRLADYATRAKEKYEEMHRVEIVEKQFQA
jgi:hypothetical protein